MSRIRLAITLLFCVCAAVAETTDSITDQAFMFEGTRVALTGEWQALDELIALANDLLARESAGVVETPDGRMAEGAFQDAGARLVVGLTEFEARISSGQRSAAEELYREELLPIFFDLAISWRVLEDQKRR